MKEAFVEILGKYLKAKQEPFLKHPIANYIRDTAPSIIQNEGSLSPEIYKVKGGPGQGVWAEVPWICIFDRKISETAQDGYYIVYLFRSDMTGVYLSLNMGWTQFEKKYKHLNTARTRIRNAAVTCQIVLESPLSDFSFEPIDLATQRILGVGYQLGHICGKYYSASNLPEDKILINDLRNLIGVYRELRGKLKGKSIVELESSYTETQSEQNDLEDIQYQKEAQAAKPIEVPDTPQPKPSQSYVKGHKKYPTKPSTASDCLQKAKYICESDKDHKTFTCKATGQSYVEVHHLIPMSFQDSFEVSLDVPANILAICPNCHRLLHHAIDDETCKLLSNFYSKREGRLKKAGLLTTLDQLVNCYK